MNTPNPLSASLINQAEKNIRDILRFAIHHSTQRNVIIVSDSQSPLSVALTEAYRRCLPYATYINFDTTLAEDILYSFDSLKANDLVILIQSTNFRFKDFRIRVELFQKSLKVIEHPYLSRMTGIQATYYIESLAYNSAYFHRVGHGLKKMLDNTNQVTIEGGGEILFFNGPLEPAKLNIGDYSEMKNVGGQFPIGEVFTEAKELGSVSGRVRLFAFCDTTFSVNQLAKPLTLVIVEGRVIEVVDSTPEFDHVLARIRADEGEVWVRELGFGMNRAFTKNKIVNDVGTYERMCGVHLSLGAKHTVYKKHNFKRGKTWHHIDVFVDVDFVYLNEQLVYQQSHWQI